MEEKPLNRSELIQLLSIILKLDSKAYIAKFDKNFIEISIYTDSIKLSLPKNYLYENCTSIHDLYQLLSQNYFVLLMTSGQAALGQFDPEGEILQHKVIRKYMIRKSQGKSQIKHLKTKGKSRLGSRIRLNQTQKFFHEINSKLQQWQLDSETNIIYLSCSIPLLSFWKKTTHYEETMNQDNMQIFKIPYHISGLTFEKLLYMNKLIHQTSLSFNGQFELPDQTQLKLFLKGRS